MTEKLCRLLKDSPLCVHSIEIIRNEEILLHKAFDEDIPYPVYSAAKSVTSMGFSLCWDDGILSPDAILGDFIENKYKPFFPKGFDKLPFERFLTMTSGSYPFRPQGEDWMKYIFSLDVDFSDTAFHYSNIPAYLVGAACENALGQNLMSYLEKRIFDPLGMAAPEYTLCPQGHFYGATGMKMTVHQLALLGQLCLQKGNWKGKQLISREAVTQATSPHVFTGSDYYGYFFRIAPDHFSIVGKWGQRCMIYPELGIVAAYLSDCPRDPDGLYETVHSYITHNFDPLPR